MVSSRVGFRRDSSCDLVFQHVPNPRYTSTVALHLISCAGLHPAPDMDLPTSTSFSKVFLTLMNAVQFWFSISILMLNQQGRSWTHLHTILLSYCWAVGIQNAQMWPGSIDQLISNQGHWDTSF
ncbi:hypothetical protein EJB05_15027 [Eragrostis curvula]|uniref:Uncharacterized protein n=1 Tax=Eragrostis curvula TaxID=38414 RepID=A0A5J9W0N3_9POAL|nr:hypothetical protein EJB05_15027 [Eragrostis curvula]